MSNPFPPVEVPEQIPEVVPENIDPETMKLIEETSGNVLRASILLEPELAAKLVRLAMLAAYRCWEAAESKKNMERQAACQR